MTQALEQFGKEQSVAQAWKQECETTTLEAGRGTFWSAIRPAIKWSLLNKFLYPLLIAAYAYLHGYTPKYWMSLSHLGNAGIALVVMELLLFSTYLGFLVGRRARGKILTLSLLALPGITMLSGCLSRGIYESFGLFAASPVRSWGEYLLSFSVSYAFSLSLSAMGAGAAVWQHRKPLRPAGSR